MSLSFAKEAVQPVHATTGLLSSTLALTRSESLGSSVNVTNSSGASSSSTPSAPSTSSSHSSASLSKLEFSAARQRTLYTVANVVSAVVKDYMTRTGRPENMSSNSGSYSLMIADDDGNVDNDFPEADGSVAITSIGVDKFILCDAATTRAILLLSIPEGDVGRLRTQAAVASSLSSSSSSPSSLVVTCTPKGGSSSGALTPFIVTIG